MRKLTLVALTAVLGLTLFVARINAGEQMAGGIGTAFAANDIIDVLVKDPQGDVLGRIADLVVDSEGRVALAVLSHGGFLGINEKGTAVPFSALRYDPKAKYLILDMSKEKLAAAPAFKMSDLSFQKGSEDNYRYFVQGPYWSEEEELCKGIK